MWFFLIVPFTKGSGRLVLVKKMRIFIQVFIQELKLVVKSGKAADIQNDKHFAGARQTMGVTSILSPIT